MRVKAEQRNDSCKRAVSHSIWRISPFVFKKEREGHTGLAQHEGE